MFMKGKNYDKRKKRRKWCVDLLKLRSHLKTYPCLYEIWNIDSMGRDEIQFHVISCKNFCSVVTIPKQQVSEQFGWGEGEF